jgi:hypothetical protein
VGTISKSDSAYFDEVLAAMVSAGEIEQRGPFISDPTQRHSGVL